MKRSIFAVSTLLALLLTMAIFVPIAAAQCADGTSGNDTISCTGTDPDGVVGYDGNDIITVEAGATVNNPDGNAVQGDDGDDELTNNGSINASRDGLQGGRGGNDTLINNGNITAGDNVMEVLNDEGDTALIINNGTGTSERTGIYGDDGNETIINNGELTSTDSDGINGYFGDDTIINNGTVTGASGTAIYGHNGDDTVQILVGSQVNGNLDGGWDTDTLVFEVQGDQSVHDAFNTYITDNGITVDTGSLTFSGKTYNWTNFEELDFLLTIIELAVEAANNSGSGSGSGDAPVQTGPQSVCDGGVKVFGLPNGDLQVYSGFDVMPPNGFLVGYVSLFDVAAGTTIFQDPGTAAELGWTVEVTIQPDASLSLQVFDGAHNPVGNVCFIG